MIQVALITGRSNPRSCALSATQTRFLARLASPSVRLVATNYPYREDPPSHRAVTMIAASARNGAQFAVSRLSVVAAQRRGVIAGLVAAAPHTVFVAGSCGLELIASAGLPPLILSRMSVFAYGPVALSAPNCALFTVQGRRDPLSRVFFSSVTGWSTAAISTTWRVSRYLSTVTRSSPKSHIALVATMRIDLLAPPFRGHLHPTLAMARELSTEFDVRVISTPGTMQAIEASGVAGRSILSSEEEARCFAIANVDRPVRANVLRMYRQVREAVFLMCRLQDDLRAVYREAAPDLVIADFTLAGVGVVADEFGIPWWTSTRSPSVLETPDGPPAYLGGLRPATGASGRLAFAVLRRLIRFAKRGLFLMQCGALRRMGIVALYRADRSEALYSPHCILAAGVERLEFPASWPATLSFVGPQLYTPPSDCASPPFVDGRVHVLVTCGTHLPWFKDRLARAAAQVAAALPDVVVHFTDGAPGSNRAESDGNFVRLGYVDYDRHLERYAVVVHHGGSGILYGCLARGVPAVVHPLDYDQFDNAARADSAGVALWIRSLDALPDKVRQAIADSPLKARCVGLQEEMRAVAEERRVLGLARRFAHEHRERIP